MPFKNHWEKTAPPLLLEKTIIEEMLQSVLPNQKPFSYEIISGGCANLNIQFKGSNQSAPQLLRIYLRDKEAAYREQKLAALIGKSVPIPQIYFIGDLNDYRFAITEYKQGITLREALLSGKIETLENIMNEAGSILARIQSYRFPHSGFFDRDLNVLKMTPEDNYMAFAKKCLIHPTTIQQISKVNLSKIENHLERYHSFFPNQNQNHLVHGDYDPANLLVQQSQGTWKISAILDWEFAFSGSPLWDVSNMLRYAHKMPLEYEEGFLQGLRKGGMQLPEDWRITTSLLNLLSLLDCLTRSSPTQHPNQCADICNLIAFFIQKLDHEKKHHHSPE